MPNEPIPSVLITITALLLCTAVFCTLAILL